MPGRALKTLSSPVLQLHYRVCGPGEHLCSQDLPCPPCLENHHCDTRWDLKKGSPLHIFPSLELRFFHSSQQFLVLLTALRKQSK